MRTADKREAYEAWGRILKLAHDLDRLSPGAGRLFLRQVTATLDQIRDQELSRLSTFQKDARAS